MCELLLATSTQKKKVDLTEVPILVQHCQEVFRLVQQLYIYILYIKYIIYYKQTQSNR